MVFCYFNRQRCQKPCCKYV